VLIENEMKAAMPALSNCMVIGDRKKFLTMIISLKNEADKETGLPTDKLASDALHVSREIGSDALSMSAAAKCEKWKAYLDNGTKTANKKAASSAQNVQKWTMLPVDFSEKAGDLTPTQKLKRSVVTTKYTDLIESMYAGDKE
jgi:long-chain-fatty-acid--CoA ligase ACSBG